MTYFPSWSLFLRLMPPEARGRQFRLIHRGENEKAGAFTSKNRNKCSGFRDKRPGWVFRGLPSFNLMWRGLDAVAAIFYAIFARKRNARASARVIVRSGEKVVVEVPLLIPASTAQETAV